MAGERESGARKLPVTASRRVSTNIQKRKLSQRSNWERRITQGTGTGGLLARTTNKTIPITSPATPRNRRARIKRIILRTGPVVCASRVASSARARSIRPA